MNLFDSHCHLEDESFEYDWRQTLERMASAGVNHCILGASDMATSERIVQMVDESPMIYGVVGVHPHEASTWTDEAAAHIEEWVKHKRIVGMGEMGLDYFYDHSPRDVQKDVLVRQLLLAHKLGVPAVFHIRDAHGDMLDLLRANKSTLPSGVLHCYSGSVESAKEYLDMGFYLSFAGPVTFKNALKLQEVAKYCPKDRLLVETDSPYLAPVPMRGKRNEPTYVRYVAELIARLRGVSPDELAKTATDNTCRLFGIDLSGEATHAEEAHA